MPLRGPFAKGAGRAALRLYQEMRNADSFSGLAIQGLLLEIIAKAAGDAGRRTILLPRCN